MRTWEIVGKGFALVALACLAWGCSNANSSAPNLNTAGQHSANWVNAHQAAALDNISPCYVCHGTDLKGGISQVSCFSAQFNGQFCHAQGPSGHPAGWRDPGLHGAAAKSQPGTTSGFANCQVCHGADFAGGIVGVSCFVGSRATGSCHGVAAPHAATPWRTYPFPTHTETVDDAAGSNAAVCALCHTAGRNLTTTIIPTPTYVAGKPGCFNSTLCHGSVGNPHPPGWVKPIMHCIAARGNLDSCQTCHADKPTGGPGSNPRFNINPPGGRLTFTNLTTTYTGCEVCHAKFSAHPPVVRIPAFFGNLTTFNPINTPWYLHCKASPSGFDTCNRCHGAALDGVGGIAPPTAACTYCHRSGLPLTLLHCTSCHADPPNGTTYPNIARVHAVHTNGTRSAAFTCDDCHYGLGTVGLDHFNRAQAHTSTVQGGAVAFGAFAATSGLTPTYSDTTLQCTNTYCHGNSTSIIGGTNKSPIWSSTTYLTAAGCGTCHGFPPAAPHTGAGSTATQCINCHPHVNASGTGFTDPTKHINGAIEAVVSGAGGGAAPHTIPLPVGGYPGSVHKSAVSPFTSCLGCHTIGTNIGVYPAVPAGTAPDCQGCHIKAAPGNSCGSCHGTASNGGRPDGLTLTTFPNIKGQHSSNHGGFSCTTCHSTSGTGNAAHGSSGGVAHNGVNFPVVVQLPAGITFTPTTVGHGTCNGTCNGQGHNPRTW